MDFFFHLQDLFNTYSRIIGYGFIIVCVVLGGLFSLGSNKSKKASTLSQKKDSNSSHSDSSK